MKTPYLYFGRKGYMVRAAIANGDYPIDADRIADALMDVYREMKT